MNEITLNGLVDEIFMINLDRRNDRMEKMSKRLNRLCISYKRISGVDGQNLDVGKDYVKAVKSFSRITSVGAFGCLLTHLSILRMAKENKFKRILIMEDDLLFIKDFGKELQKVKNVPDDWEILFLGASQQLQTVGKIPIKNGCYYRAINTYGMFCYIIKDTFYDKLIDIFEKKMVNCDYSLVALENKFKFYVMMPNLVIADIHDSDTVYGTKTRVVSEFEVLKYSKQLGWDLDKYDRE